MILSRGYVHYDIPNATLDRTFATVECFGISALLYSADAEPSSE